MATNHRKLLVKSLAPLLEPHGWQFDQIPKAGLSAPEVHFGAGPGYSLRLYLGRMLTELGSVLVATPPEVAQLFRDAGCQQASWRLTGWSAVACIIDEMANPLNADGFFNSNDSSGVPLDRADLEGAARAYYERRFLPHVLPLHQVVRTAQGLDGWINPRQWPEIAEKGQEKSRRLTISIGQPNQVLVGAMAALLAKRPGVEEMLRVYDGFMKQLDPAKHDQVNNFYRVVEYFGIKL
jgi:hypothetical protein